MIVSKNLGGWSVSHSETYRNSRSRYGSGCRFLPRESQHTAIGC